MSDVSLVFNLIGRDSGVNEMINRTSANVKRANLASAASTVAFGLAMTSAGAYAVTFAAGVGQAVGVLATVPSFVLGAAASFTVLKLATSGLGAALKSSTGGAARAAFDYAAAEHRIETAQRAALRAQQALDDARRTAADNIEKLSRQLRGAQLDEEGALLAVARAEQGLRRAQASGTGTDIREADLALRQAVQTLDEARDRTRDLGTEQQDAAAKGVEGSDAVVRAIEQQRDATYELAQAQQALAKGADSGGGGGSDPAAEAFAKLSPAGQELVTTIKSIGPSWSAMQRQVQQATLAGVAGDLRLLSATYLPTVERRLSGVGSAFNRAGHETTAFLALPSTVRTVDGALANVVKTSDALGRSIKPFMSAFLQLSDTAGGGLVMLAEDVQSLAERFDRFITKARETGKLAEWTQNGVVAFRQVIAVVWNLGSALVAIFRANSDSGASMLTWLADATGRMAAFLHSAEGQEKVSQVFTTLRDLLGQVVSGASQLRDTGGGLNATWSVTSVVMKFLAEHLGLVAQNLPLIIGLFLLYKTSQTAANVATVASVPIQAAKVAAMFGHSAALRANTAAMRANMVSTNASTAATGANTAATNLGILAKTRAIAETVALKAAELAGVAVRGVATAAQWALNVAMSANPIGLIIIAVVALVAGFLYLWNHSEAFRNFWIGTWEMIKGAALFVWRWMTDTLWPGIKAVWEWISDSAGKAKDWIVEKFDAWIAYLTGLPGRVSASVRNLWDGFRDGAKNAINTVLGFWNRLDFGIHIRVPDWVPGIGGWAFNIDDIFPDIPLLAEGGIVPATPGGRLLVAGEAGEDEAVIPLSKLGGGLGGPVVIELRSGGSALDDLLVEILRRAIRARGGSVVRVLEAR
ncbi:hypothetical protein ABT297_04030 [Dactylosporangium sp. NPDC000555]|uniref:hypothetical protein n=1 Tax=Dactylosporangium sp. NPDC000555 TaxID=3154260 RepID=UPI00331AB07D